MGALSASYPQVTSEAEEQFVASTSRPHVRDLVKVDRPQPHATELTYLAEGGIDPLELRNVVDEIHTLICNGMPGTRITGLSLTDHVLKVVIA